MVSFVLIMFFSKVLTRIQMMSSVAPKSLLVNPQCHILENTSWAHHELFWDVPLTFLYLFGGFDLLFWLSSDVVRARFHGHSFIHLLMKLAFAFCTCCFPACEVLFTDSLYSLRISLMRCLYEDSI